MLKKMIIILLAVTVLAGAGLAYFIVTFDAEHYRPLIETKAAELTGFPVKLGGVSLTWKNGMALEVNDLTLKVREEDEDPAPVSVHRAYVVLEVMPLLRGTVQVGSILVEDPTVRVIRSPDGRLRGAAELGSVKPEQKPQGPTGAESTLALLIQNLNLRGGKVFFQDQSGGRVRDYTVEQIELSLRNVSLLSSFPVELKAAVLSGKQNVLLSGKVQVRLTKQEIDLKNFTLTTDLEDLSEEKLAQAFPELKESGIPSLTGRLNARLADVTLSEKQEPSVNLQVQLSRGGLGLPDIEAVKNIELSSELSGEGLRVQSLSADWGGGHLASSLEADWRKAPLIHGTLQAVLSDVDLARVLPPPAGPREPGFQGIAAMNFRGSFSGSDSNTLMNTLSGEGQILVKDGVITNLNVLKEVLSKLSMIPGVSQKLQSRLSEEYLRKLEERDTRLEDMTLPVRTQEGTVFLDSVVIQSDTFQIRGQARAAMSGPLSGRLFAAVDPEFSEALIRSVNELQYITDQNRQITIPLMIRGTFERPEIVPEVQQLASKLAVATTQDLLSGLLSKKKQGQTEAGSPASQPALPSAQGDETASFQPNVQDRPSDPFAALLGQVLQAAVQKKQE